MANVLSITSPIFLLIALGYGAVRYGLFSKDETRAMGRLVINFALPAVLFRAIAERPLAEIVSLPYLLAYGLGSVTLLAAAVLLFRKRGHSLSAAAVLGLGSASSNTAFIGLPIVTQFLGPAATAAVAMTMLVETLLMVPLALGLAEGAGGSGGIAKAVRGSLLNLVRTPMILAIVAGAIVSLLGLNLPVPLAKAIELLAGASTPVALFVIGGALFGLSLRGVVADVALVSGFKLILHPLAVVAGLALFAPADPLIATAGIVLAASPMLSTMPLLAQRYGAEDVSAAALVVATASSFVTISTLLWLLGS